MRRRSPGGVIRSGLPAVCVLLGEQMYAEKECASPRSTAAMIVSISVEPEARGTTRW